MSTWQVRDRAIRVDRPIVIGILNVTPDSFSDGGNFFSPDAAVAHARRMAADGADVVDVGGESTRPQGAVPVDADEECARVVPVIGAVRAALPDLLVSVDTSKAAVAEAALAAGAHVVNDVSAFRLDARMAETCARHGAGVILMHSRGGVREMATFVHATYTDVVEEVAGELARAMETGRAAGVADDAIVLDPGVGFAKRGEHSLAVLAGLPRLATLGRPLLVGASRKRFIGEITRVTEPADRVHGTTGAHVAALCAGARLFRVHDVRAARESLDVAWAVLRAGARA